MAMGNKLFKSVSKITLAHQMFAIRQRYSLNIVENKIKNNVLKCKVRVRPTEQSREYLITVEYKTGVYPRVFLINQGIMTDATDNLPHCYERKYYSSSKERVKLCLFYPGRGEWNNTMLIADTIIPWAVEWLYYYEKWRMTGEWYGGGEHPKKK